MTDASAVARDQLRAFIERIERLEEEKKTIADDIKDVKAEAKGCGFDVTIINAIIKLRKVDANERAEHEALLDTYMIALGMLPEPVGAEEDHDRETGEVFDGEVTAKLIATVATGMQTEIGRKALVTALDIMIEREEAGENSPETATRPGQDVQSPSQRAMAGENLDVTGGESAATNSEKTTSAASHAANAGGDDVDRSGSPATHLVIGEGTARALPHARMAHAMEAAE